MSPNKSVIGYRRPFIDVLRGIGIVLVVLGHNPDVLAERTWLVNAIYSFHMPLFFLTSGIFVSRTARLWEVARHRAETLLKPYFVVLTALGLLKGVFVGVAILPYILGVLYATGETIYWVPLWFLPHLFLAVCVVQGIIGPLARKRLFERVPKSFVIVILLLIIITGSGCTEHFSTPHTALTSVALLSTEWPWSADLLVISVPYIMIGAIIKDDVLNFKSSIKGASVSLVVFVLLQIEFGQTMDLNLRWFPNPVLQLAQSALAIYVSFNIASWFCKLASLERLFALIGQASLFILLFHYPIQFQLYKFAAHGYSKSAAAISLLAGVGLPVVFYTIASRTRLLRKLLLA